MRKTRTFGNKERFFRLNTVEDFEIMTLAAIRRYKYEISSHPELKFIEEAYIASRFAVDVSALQARLLPEERPDFEIIDRKGQKIKFEATQADRPERKRSAEHKAILSRIREDGKGFIEDIPDDRWLTQENTDEDLRRATLKKSDGRYNPSWGLVIYLLGLETHDPDEPIEQVMHGATMAASELFRSVSVVTNSKVVHLWRDGCRQEL